MISIGVSVCILEIIIRVFGLTSDVFHQAAPDTGVWHQPDKTGVYFRKDVPKVSITINSQGLRDHEYPLSKPENTYRIAILGDSFSEALQVPLEATYHQRLEDQLNNSIRSKQVEIINFGIGGFGTVQEYFVFRHHVLQYQPDMILLEFMLGNDVMENSPVLNGRKYLPYLKIGEDNHLTYVPPGPVPFYMKLGSHLKIIPFFYFRLVSENPILERLLRGIQRQSKNETGIPHPYSIYATTWDTVWQDAWTITERALLQLYQESSLHHMKFMIFSIPEQLQVDNIVREEVLTTYPVMRDQIWDWEKPNKRLQQFCDRTQIQCVDLTAAFKKKLQEGSPPLYYHYDGHWNQEGHQLAAQILYEILKDEL